MFTFKETLFMDISTSGAKMSSSASPSVVDKTKMVFHYVAKIREGTGGGGSAPEMREMKVCFRNSKHSIKCDVSAPCLECDQGLKLYSWDQCRRHVDVVRAERRFESSETDRSEELLERLIQIDENGKRAVQLLEALSREDTPSLSHPKHVTEEERVWRESTCQTLKEISKNSLRAHKNIEEVTEMFRKSEMTSLLSELQKQTLFMEKSSEMSSKALESSERTSKAFNALNLSIEGALDKHVQEVKRELTRVRIDAEERFARALKEVLAEMQSLNETSRDLRDGLPERLMDAFGGILMLSAHDRDGEGGGGGLREVEK